MSKSTNILNLFGISKVCQAAERIVCCVCLQRRVPSEKVGIAITLFSTTAICLELHRDTDYPEREHLDAFSPFMQITVSGRRQRPSKSFQILHLLIILLSYAM
jgi:hypothetical protein